MEEAKEPEEETPPPEEEPPQVTITKPNSPQEARKKAPVAHAPAAKAPVAKKPPANNLSALARRGKARGKK